MRANIQALLVAVLALAASPATAESVYAVSIDTSTMIGHPAGPFSLNLQLTDGTGLSDGNNTAILSGFFFNGGGPAGLPLLEGGVTGSLSTSVTMTDSAFFNSFTQTFSPGSLLSFTLSLTTFADAGGTPDEFSLAILDSAGHEIPTLAFAALGTDSILVVDITGPAPVAHVYGGDPSRPPFAGGTPIAFPTPLLAPEPGTTALLAIGLAAGLLSLMRRHYAPK